MKYFKNRQKTHHFAFLGLLVRLAFFNFNIISRRNSAAFFFQDKSVLKHITQRKYSTHEIAFVIDSILRGLYKEIKLT